MANPSTCPTCGQQIDMARTNGQKGGHARKRNLSPSQLSKIGTHAARTRWKQKHDNDVSAEQPRNDTDK